jgi:hypothetical protein
MIYNGLYISQWIVDELISLQQEKLACHLIVIINTWSNVWWSHIQQQQQYCQFKVNITYGFFYMEMDETHKKFIQWMKWQKL